MHVFSLHYSGMHITLYVSSYRAMQDTPAVCNLKMICTLSGHEDVRTLVLHTSCPTVLEVKKEIEEQYSIASCVQSLTFHNVHLSDTDALNPTHISKDEVISVSYPSEANISGVREAVEWLTRMHAALQKQTRGSSRIWSSEISGLISQAVTSGTIHNLSVSLFYPWEAGQRYMNKIYFDDCGGLAMLCSVVSHLLQLNWDVMHQDLKYLEVICTQSITNFLQSFELRRRFIELRGLDLCIGTLLRHKLVLDMPLNLNRMSSSAIEVALYAICK